MASIPTHPISAASRAQSDASASSLPLQSSGSAALSLPDPYSLLDAYDASRRAMHRGTLTPAPHRDGAAASKLPLTPNPGLNPSLGTPSQLDPVAFLNQHYQTEASLTAQLFDLREAVSHRMQTLEDRIATALQRQSETAASTRQHVQDAKAHTVTLERRIRLVQEKAKQSEQAVLQITADMKLLDGAKRHLQRTITTLKRLHMLVHAVEELRITAQKKPFPDYAAASRLVEATRIFLRHFEAYQAKVPPMQRLSRTVHDIQEELRKQAFQGFQSQTSGLGGPAPPTSKPIDAGAPAATIVNFDSASSSELLSTPMPPDVMRGAVMYLDALGQEVREQFILEFSQGLLRGYVQRFSPPRNEKKPEKRVSSFKVNPEPVVPEKSPASLDLMEQRFLWFRTLLEDGVQSKFPGVFPTNWNVQASVAKHFLVLTRKHILALLREGPYRDPQATNATVLLKALQKTLVFEKEITGWLQRECQTVFSEESAGVPAPGKPAREESKAESAQKDFVVRVDPLVGVASQAFNDFMTPYIALEEQSMDELLVEALDKNSVDNRGERPVFISSTNLFVYIKGSITRCTALTKGKAFYLLYTAFQDSLRKYGLILDGKLPKAESTSSTNVVPGLSIAGLTSNKQGTNDVGTDAVYKIPAGEEVTICHVITTCEYCTDTVEALEDLIRDTIDPPYAGTIDMNVDQERFHELIAKAIRVLVSGLTQRCVDPALKQGMGSINWGTWDAVGEESDYVRTIHEEIEPFVVKVKSLMPTSYFRSFCDKFAMSFCATYYDSLIKLKRISEPGTQQLLLDVYNLKTLFLRIPVLEKSLTSSTDRFKSMAGTSTIAPAMYTKMVQKQFGKIETVLKLVGTPTDLLIDNFKVQWSSGTPGDLQMILSLKGIKRPEQVTMLEKFGLNPARARKGAAAGVTGASIVTERVQSIQSQGSNVAAKVTSDMRQKVEDLRKSFR